MPVQNIRPNDVLHNVPFIHKKSGMLYGVYVWKMKRALLKENAPWSWILKFSGTAPKECLQIPQCTTTWRMFHFSTIISQVVVSWPTTI